MTLLRDVRPELVSYAGSLYLAKPRGAAGTWEIHRSGHAGAIAILQEHRCPALNWTPALGLHNALGDPVLRPKPGVMPAYPHGEYVPVCEQTYSAAIVALDELMPVTFESVEFGEMPGYVRGRCEHRVARSEWRAGFRVCEGCPSLRPPAPPALAPVPS